MSGTELNIPPEFSAHDLNGSVSVSECLRRWRFALLRLGVEYWFGIGKGIEVTPGIAIDLTEDEHATVIGAVFSKKF